MNREQLEEIRARAAGFKELLDADVEDGDLAIEVAKDVPALLDEIDRLNTALDAITDLHEPREDFRKRLVCDHCSSLCHSRSGLGCDDPDALYPCETARLATSAGLWDLVDGPKPGFCCQDAYASHGKPETLHTSGCPRRCSQPVRTERGPIEFYPCGLSKGHAGGCWLHPAYRTDGHG